MFDLFDSPGQENTVWLALAHNINNQQVVAGLSEIHSNPLLHARGQPQVLETVSQKQTKTINQKKKQNQKQHKTVNLKLQYISPYFCPLFLWKLSKCDCDF